ncbi:MAG: hypothetical protein IPG89_10045 [Bacteroidetes bacterium]|nr:hypothetical protein [Bacteroidota bacterium]
MKISVIILFLFYSFHVWACSCRWPEDRFEYYKNNTHSFIGKIYKLETNSKKNIRKYYIEVVNKLRSHVGKKTIIFIDANEACSQHMTGPSVGKTYLFSGGKWLGKYYIDQCSFVYEENSEAYRQDSMLIMLFTKKNFNIDCFFFKATVINGKREGEFIDYYIDLKDQTKKISEKVNFVNGKLDGIFINHNEEVEYKSGKFIKRLETLSDTVTVIQTPELLLMYYKKDTLVKKLDYKNNELLFYSIYGWVKTKYTLHRQGVWAKEKISYNKEGKIEKIIKLEYGYEEALNLFYGYSN